MNVAVATMPPDPYEFTVTFPGGEVYQERQFTEQDVYDRVAMLVRMHGPYQSITFDRASDPMPELAEIAHI